MADPFCMRGSSGTDPTALHNRAPDAPTVAPHAADDIVVIPQHLFTSLLAVLLDSFRQPGVDMYGFVGHFSLL